MTLLSTKKSLVSGGLFFVFLLLSATVAMASGDAGHGAAHGGGWTSTDWWRVMNFAVLFIGLFMIFKKVGAPALNDRVEGIKQELTDLASKKEAAIKKMGAYEKRLENLEKEAADIVADYIRQGEAAKVKILEEAKTAADRLSEQAKRHMDHEFAQARERLREEVLEQAINLSKNEIQNNINPDDQNRLVGEYLDKVVAQ